jgi:hypothetical protein
MSIHNGIEAALRRLVLRRCEKRVVQAEKVKCLDQDFLNPKETIFGSKYF